MLQKLQQVAQEGTISIHHCYLGHIKKDEDRKLLAHAQATAWEDVEPSVRVILEHHLYQAIEGELGQVNFPGMYTGEVLSVAKVASEDFDRFRNRPTVEVLELVRNMTTYQEAQFIEAGNTLAYKVMAAGAIRNHLVALLRFSIVPQLNAAPVSFVFATLIDLDDKEDSLFDEGQGKFVTTELHNVVKKASVSRAVFFPCLDDQGREMADMLVYVRSSGGAWFKALEAYRRFRPEQEGRMLIRMIAEQTSGDEVPQDLFARMGQELAASAEIGISADETATSLEKAVGHGIDRLGFQARWESAFGDLSYRPEYCSLFDREQEKPAMLKLQAGDLKFQVPPAQLDRFRQVKVDGRTFVLFEVPEVARAVVAKDLDLRIRPVAIEDVRAWMEGSSSDA